MPAVLLAGNFLSASGGSRSVLEDLEDRLRIAGCTCIGVSRKRNGIARGLDLLATALTQRRRYGVAVVDLYSGRAFLWGEMLSLVLRASGCPFVLVLRGGGLPKFASAHERRVTACLARATVVCAPSPYLLDQMRAYRKDLLLLPNPLEICRYDFRLRRNPAPHLVWLRAFEELYNPQLAIQVLALLHKSQPDVRLTMIGGDRGDGSRQRCEALARRAGVFDRITFAGAVMKRNVPEWLNRGDIFINTTRVDNTPVSVLEAMACGLPVVTTKVGGIPYLLSDGEDALLVPSDDAQAMSDAVQRLLAEPHLPSRLSSQGRQKAERYDWSNAFPAWVELLTSQCQ